MISYHKLNVFQLWWEGQLGHLRQKVKLEGFQEQSFQVPSRKTFYKQLWLSTSADHANPPKIRPLWESSAGEPRSWGTTYLSTSAHLSTVHSTGGPEGLKRTGSLLDVSAKASVRIPLPREGMLPFPHHIGQRHKMITRSPLEAQGRRILTHMLSVPSSYS